MAAKFLHDWLVNIPNVFSRWFAARKPKPRIYGAPSFKHGVDYVNPYEEDQMVINNIFNKYFLTINKFTFNNTYVNINIIHCWLCVVFQEIYGYNPKWYMKIIAWIMIILTGGILRLLFHWKPDWMLYCTHMKCPLERAKKVLLVVRFVFALIYQS
jgi:hypothetical protein